MTIRTITGNVAYANGTNPPNSRVEFYLNGIHIDEVTIAHSAVFANVGPSGAVSVNLYPNEGGYGANRYNVDLVNYQDTQYIKEIRRVNLGKIYVEDINGQVLQDLLALFSAPAGELSPAEAASLIAIDAAADAAASAALADDAQEASFLNANVYASTAAGLAATTVGDQFQVVSGSEIIRYRHDAGPVAVEVARYPSTAAVTTLSTRADFVDRRLFGAVNASANLLNILDADYTIGSRINDANGALVVVAGWEASGFIPVLASTSYWATSGNTFRAFYNAARVFIGAGTQVGNVYTSPAGAAFMRISLHVAGGNVPATFMVAQGSTAVAFEPYGGIIETDRVIGLTGASIANGAITPPKTSFLTLGKNLFDIATVTQDFYIAANGVPVANAAYVYSDLIPVVAGGVYVANRNIRFRAAYDAGGVVIPASGSNSDLASGTTWTIPAGVSFVRLSITPKANASAVQFERSATITAYEPYGYDMSPLIRLPSAAVSSLWTGKAVAFMGDSLTSQAQFITPTAAAISLLVTNYGIGGTKIATSDAQAMWQDARINAIPTTVDAVHVMGGTNDWANNGPLGTIASTDTETFYGALNVMAEKLATRFPTKHVFLGTAPLSSMTLPRFGFTDTFTNSQGLTMLDYAAAVRAVAHRWGFPVIDYALDAGFNRVNLSSYMLADGNFIHPNTAGGKRMSAVLIGRLRELEPIA